MDPWEEDDKYLRGKSQRLGRNGSCTFTFGRQSHGIAWLQGQIWSRHDASSVLWPWPPITLWCVLSISQSSMAFLSSTPKLRCRCVPGGYIKTAINLVDNYLLAKNANNSDFEAVFARMHYTRFEQLPPLYPKFIHCFRVGVAVPVSS